MRLDDKKDYLKEHIFKNSERCGRIIDNYRTQTIAPYQLESNADYIHGYEERIEKYAKAEGTTQKIYYLQLCRRSAQFGKRAVCL